MKCGLPCGGRVFCKRMPPKTLRSQPFLFLTFLKRPPSHTALPFCTEDPSTVPCFPVSLLPPLPFQFLVLLFAPTGREALLNREFLELDVLLLIEQGKERFAEGLGGESALEGQEERWEEEEIREHRHGQGNGNEQPE